ncbi:hypothetical protein PO909_010662 [Leuciscus waleckii]
MVVSEAFSICKLRQVVKRRTGVWDIRRLFEGRGSLVEPRVGGAKRSQRVEVERRDQRPEAEPQDPLAQVLMVVAQPEPSRRSKAFPGKAKGGMHPAEVELEDWLSSEMLLAHTPGLTLGLRRYHAKGSYRVNASIRIRA